MSASENPEGLPDIEAILKQQGNESCFYARDVGASCDIAEYDSLDEWCVVCLFRILAAAYREQQRRITELEAENARSFECGNVDGVQFADEASLHRFHLHYDGWEAQRKQTEARLQAALEEVAALRKALAKIPDAYCRTSWGTEWNNGGRPCGECLYCEFREARGA